MNAFSITDHECMARALQLALRGVYSTHPNPRVGCVLWRDGEVVGEGWHRAAGEMHAEVAALEAAGDRARGATAYVTLEPCAHQGRTGPCSEALIKSGISRVVIATRDPFVAASQRGIDELRASDIRAELGLMESAARSLNEGFFSRVERRRPFVRLKLAASIDGATAMSNGDSQWITGDAARADVQRLRARSDAIVTGIGTVLMDDPSLTVRDIVLHRDGPLRVVADSNLKTPVAAKVLSNDAPTLLCCTNDSQRASVERRGVEVIKVDAMHGQVLLDALLEELGRREINEVLVEAGPRLAGAFIEQHLVDELVIYQAPHIMGSATRPLAVTPALATLADRLSLSITDRRQLGADTRITARPAR